jgi:hypothetical protein
MKRWMLAFQAYVYFPPEDGGNPGEVNYAHYIFDISRTE